MKRPTLSATPVPGFAVPPLQDTAEVVLRLRLAVVLLPLLPLWLCSNTCYTRSAVCLPFLVMVLVVVFF